MGKIADISKYQGNVDWVKARKELDFIILRASCGMSIDSKYLDNAANCGLPFGVYHYVKAGSISDAQKEAEFFVACANKAAVKPLFYIADIEYKAQTALTTEPVCAAFLDKLRALGCEKIGLYINTRYKWAGSAIDRCDIMWIPHWGKNDGSIPADQYKPKHPHDLWQYTSRGRVSGIKGNVDLNAITGSKPLAWFTARKEEKPMNEQANRALVPFTNEHFAAWLEGMVGRPYWYGTCVYKCTESLRARKAKQYPSHYGSSRTSRYRQDIAAKEVCADCIGAAKGYAWTGGGNGVVAAIGTDGGISSKYKSNNCPDKGANGMFAYAKSKGMPWGAIGTIPEIVGLAVTTSGHVGYYVGGGYVIEFKGFAYGCARTKLSAGKWTHWYMLPFIDYGTGDLTTPAKPADPAQPTAPIKYTLGSRLLKQGCKGDDVTELQGILVRLGYNLGDYGTNKDGVDGSYGAKTTEAVKAFQRGQQISVDGKYGTVTHAALMGVLADMSAADPEPDDETETTPKGKRVVVTGNSVNVRTGPSTSYKIITRQNKGDTLPFVATAEAVRWHAVEINGKIGWISGKYSEVSSNGD